VVLHIKYVENVQKEKFKVKSECGYLSSFICYC